MKTRQRQTSPFTNVNKAQDGIKPMYLHVDSDPTHPCDQVEMPECMFGDAVGVTVGVTVGMPLGVCRSSGRG